MLCNLSKTHQVVPMAMRVSSQSQPLIPFPISKLQFFSYGSFLKPSQNPSFAASGTFTSRSRKSFQLIEPRKACIHFHGKRRQLGRVGRFLSYSAANRDERNGESLPWLADGAAQEPKLGKNLNVKVKVRQRSSWEESAEKLLQRSSNSMAQERLSGGRTGKTNFEKKKKQVEWDDEDNGGNFENKKKQVEWDDEDNGGEEDGGGEAEAIDDPRWDKIKTRVDRVVYPRRGSERPEMRRWDRQENWGRKTFKQATESSLPKMVGEGVYGVGPVLAALSAGRREFYALYVQEGLDLSGNNKKKKDKKGFEKVLRMADKIGLTVKEVSKHDLNMLVDNRPHQGLLLDSSPLEMVNIKELERVDEQDKGLLWIALDEVTDPQNLGAIIRSSYFFGAAGVILCAKNSAPLSGVVSKASAGSLELMELRSCKNMMQFLTSSAENGWRVLGGSVYSKAVPLDDVPPGKPTILVLGSEGTGLRPLVERSCTQLVRIPGNIPIDPSVKDAADEEEDEGETDHLSSSEEFRSFLAVESLNVSVAAGVLLNHLIGSNYRTRGNQSSSNENESLQ